MNAHVLWGNQTAALGALDWLTLSLYFFILLCIAWWVVRQKNDSAGDYFLAGRNAGWFIIGASLFASNIGSEHLVGLAGTGAKDGMAMAHYELHAWCLLVLGWIMVPFYERACVFTMPEFLEKRYCGAARMILSVISLIAYVFTKISVSLFAGGIVFKALFPAALLPGIDNFWLGAFLMVFITGLYTVIGGLRAVLYTEAIQTIVLLLGTACVLGVGLWQVGGWTALKEICQDAPRMTLFETTNAEGVVEAVIGPDTSGPKLDFFNLWKPNSDPSFPWLGLLVGAPIVGLWYWCTDQYIVQRVLAAKDVKTARRGTIFGAYLKMLPVFLFIVPGMIAYALATQGKIGAEVLTDPNSAFPTLVRDILPVGLKGLVVGGLLAALMSSLASVFNSCSTLFTMDIYKKINPAASDRQLVWTGRIATSAMVVLGFIWIPIIRYMPGTLYGYLQSVQSYIAPPIFAVFFLGVFSKRINSQGCLAGLIAGFALGMARLCLEIMNRNFCPAWFDAHPFAQWFATLSFPFMAIVLTIASCAIVAAVSLATPRPDPARIVGLTFGSMTAEERASTRASWNAWDIVLTMGLLVCIVAIYVYFTG